MFVNKKTKEKLLFADSQYNFWKMYDALLRKSENYFWNHVYFFQQCIFHRAGNM